MRGLHIPIATFVEVAADGTNEDEFLKTILDLEREVICEALQVEAAFDARYYKRFNALYPHPGPD
jgi:hypothetical protein